MSDLIPATLPQAAPNPARVPAQGPENAAASGSTSESFAAAFESAQRPAAGARAGGEAAEAEKDIQPTAITDPAAANPAAAALVVPLGPGPALADEVRPMAGAPQGLAQPVAVVLPGAVHAAAAEAPPTAVGPDALGLPAGQAAASAVQASESALATASTGDDFADVLSSLGLKPAVEPARSPAPTQAPAPAAPTGAAATNLLATAAAPAAGPQAVEFALYDVAGAVDDVVPQAAGEGSSTQASNSPAALAQTPQVPTRTHAGVLHLDTQLQLHSPRFNEGFTQQVVVLAQNGIQQAQMSLNPPELGPIDVRITMQQDAASVQIAAASPLAREAIQDALPRLRDMLDQSGVRLNDAGVFAQLPQREQSTGSQQQRPDWQAANLVDPAIDERSAVSVQVARRVGLLDAYA